MCIRDRAYAHHGAALSTAGDLQNRRIEGALIGAPDYDLSGYPNAGRVVLHDGYFDGWSAPVFSFSVYQSNASFGKAVTSAGDLNGDGAEDIAIGAPLYDDGETDEGAVFIFFGEPLLPPYPTLTNEGNRQALAQFGYAVSGMADVNGDGYNDVLVGAPFYDRGETDEGVVFVYYGSPNGIAEPAARILEVDMPGAKFGFSLSTAGDVNGDGYTDIIVGAPSFSNGEDNEGAVFVYHGSPQGLSNTYARKIESNIAGAQFGYAVSWAGDVNGDDYSDIVIGAPSYTNGQANEGAAYIYHGSASGIGATYARLLETNRANDNFGRAVSSAGDVNGDGYSDIITVSYTHLTLRRSTLCRSRWSPYH